MRDGWLIFAILIVQAICTIFFIFDILTSVLGLRAEPMAWHMREILEIGAALGLALGFILGAIALRRSIKSRREAEHRLHRASSAFLEGLEARFCAWALTPAERDVAVFLVKGMSISEIATLRNTSEGTVKAQSAAIYRKAGVSGAPQLLSLLIDDLMQIDNGATNAAQ